MQRLGYMLQSYDIPYSFQETAVDIILWTTNSNNDSNRNNNISIIQTNNSPNFKCYIFHKTCAILATWHQSQFDSSYKNNPSPYRSVCLLIHEGKKQELMKKTSQIFGKLLYHVIVCQTGWAVFSFLSVNAYFDGSECRILPQNWKTRN